MGKKTWEREGWKGGGREEMEGRTFNIIASRKIREGEGEWILG